MTHAAARSSRVPGGTYGATETTSTKQVSSAEFRKVELVSRVIYKKNVVPLSVAQQYTNQFHTTAFQKGNFAV